MRILMLTEYFYPFDRGGSAWSTYYLAKGIRQNEHQVLILTPNYGDKNYQLWRGLPIYRFWFPVKLRKKGEAVSPLWYTNLLWFFISFIALWRLMKRIPVDIIHIQGKYFLPAAILLAKLKKIPVILTLRDYQILCPYGLCIDRKREYKIYSNINFIHREIPLYLSKYHKNKNIAQKIILSFAGLRLRLISKILIFFAKRSDRIISISSKMKHIFFKNGIKSAVIYNPAVFYPRTRKPRVLPMELHNRKKEKENLLLLIGRLTWGKGAHLLIPSVSRILNKENYKLMVIGDGLLRSYMEQQAKELKVSKRVIFKGHLPYETAQAYIAEAKVTIVPSVWEEPFGRVALEALAQRIPVVTTNRGGLPEIIENGKTGYVVEPTSEEIEDAVEKAIINNRRLCNNIEKKFNQLKEKFYSQPVKQYLKLYQSLNNYL